MFIPRTLSEVRRSGNAMLWRAIGVGAIVAVALFLVLSANITLGQENLEVGQIAERDIRAQRDVTFDSASETQAARDEAAALVDPVHDTIESPVDNQADQLAAFDTLGRRVVRILDLRDAGSLDAGGCRARAWRPTCRRSGRPIASSWRRWPLPRWDVVAAAARAAVESTLAGSIRGGRAADVRASVRDLITTDLAEARARLAGDLAAELIEPNVVIDEEPTAEARDRRAPRCHRSGLDQRAARRSCARVTRSPSATSRRSTSSASAVPRVAGGHRRRQRAHRGHRRRAAGRLPVALRAGGLAPQPVGAALLPLARRERRRDPHRRRSDPVGVRRPDVGHGAAHRHPAAKLRRRGHGRRPGDPGRRHEPRRARAGRLRPGGRARRAADDHPRRAAQRVRARLHRACRW